jgi:diguanylate cyclase (GGDEF)-like protein/PAS domain S-box-containing protein
VGARDEGFERATVSDWLARAQRIRNRETSAATEPLDADDATLRQMFLAMFEHSVDGITLNARGTRVLLEVSDSFCEMSGYERDELLGRTSTELELTDPEGISALATTRADSGEAGLYETQMQRKDGQHIWVQFSHLLIGADFVLTMVRDISDRRRLEASLRRLAELDPLTGVLNRRRFQEEAERQLREAHRFGDDVALLVIDLDEFKTVNDTHGHHVGDRVLQQVADLLEEHVRAVDFVGRLGGDEFAVLVTRPGLDAAPQLAARIQRALATIKPAADGPSRVEVTIGVAVAQDAEHDYDRLLVLADRDMYANKGRA